MEELKQFENLWTTEKDKHYIHILDDTFIIMGENNMMILIENDDLNIEVIRAMLRNNIKVIKYNSKTGDEKIVSSHEALQEFDSIPRKDVKVKILWDTDISISKQLINLKKICVQISETPTVQLFKQINKEDKEWIFITMSYKRAEELIEKAHAEGIALEIEV